jgi:tetratricopeptide (TPR) repeat protein
VRVPRALCIFLAAIYGWADSTGLGSSKTLHEDWRAAMNRPVQLEEKGDLVQAERVILASILEAERRPNSDPEWLPVALTRLGGLNRLMGRDGPAEALYQQSADLWRTRFGESSLGLSLALSDLAWVYVARGQPRRAAPLWQHSLQIRIAKLGPVHPSVARIYGYMAVGAFADHRLADAELYCRHSLDIYAHTSEIAGETDLVLGSLSSIRLDRGDMKEAMHLAQRAISIQHRADRPSSRLLSGYLYNLARAESAVGQTLDADEHYRSALSLMAEPLLARSDLHCRILKGYADFLRNNGRKKEAKAPEHLAATLEKEMDQVQSHENVIDVRELG